MSLKFKKEHKGHAAHERHHRLINIHALSQKQILDAGETVSVQMDVALLERLIQSKVLCAAELRCLDKASKQALRQICLKTCRLCDACVDGEDKRN